MYKKVLNTIGLLLLLLFVTSPVFGQEGKRDKNRDRNKSSVRDNDRDKSSVRDRVSDNTEVERGDWYYEELPDFMLPDSSKIKKKRMDDYSDYVNLKTPYAPRPRHKGALEIFGGSYAISGDVTSRGGWNVGLGYRWNLGYIMSMRADVRYGKTWGQEFDFKSLIGNNQNGDRQVRNQGYARAGYVSADLFGLDNYENQNLDLALSAIINLNNIKYHRKQNVANFYVLFGIGGQVYKTMTDNLDDEGNKYSYAAIRANDSLTINASGIDREEDGNRGNGFSERRDVKEELRDIYGGSSRKRDYETAADGMDPDDLKFFNWSKNLTFHAGIGVEFLLTKWLALGVETRNTWTIGDDLLDGQRWSEQGDLTRRFDNYNQTDLKLAFNLGSNKKREMPQWWKNPNDNTMNMLAHQPDMNKVASIAENVDEKVKDLNKDVDKDGVIDRFDSEPNTPAKAFVDAKGRTLDSDKDGCPDHEDPEPFSTPLLPIKNCKNVYDFAGKECCETTSKTTIASPEYNNTPTINSCYDIVLPTIQFASNTYGVNPNDYASLNDIARKMQDCPDLRVVASGHNDTKSDIKYNEQISWNRGNASVNYLVEKYGISRDRFIVTYNGANAGGGNSNVGFRFAGEGEVGSSNPPAPHPGIKAGRK